jgi:hypothetical protein
MRYWISVLIKPPSSWPSIKLESILIFERFSTRIYFASLLWRVFGSIEHWVFDITWGWVGLRVGAERGLLPVLRTFGFWIFDSWGSWDRVCFYRRRVLLSLRRFYLVRFIITIYTLGFRVLLILKRFSLLRLITPKAKIFHHLVLHLLYICFLSLLVLNFVIFEHFLFLFDLIFLFLNRPLNLIFLPPYSFLLLSLLFLSGQLYFNTISFILSLFQFFFLLFLSLFCRPFFLFLGLFLFFELLFLITFL